VSIGPAATPEWAAFARDLGLNLRRARHARGLTQQNMAELASISLYAYQQYERGAVKKAGEATNPRLATVLVLCEVLEVPLEVLLPKVPKLTVQ
jgi:transcriptional regulator with XRE-family HTH domain